MSAKTAFILLSLLAARQPCRAAVAAAPPSVDHETFSVLGWNRDCSVAVSHLGFPRLGDAVLSDPIATRLGTLTIEAGSEEARQEWLADWKGRRTWDLAAAQTIKARLRKAGYTLRGAREILRDAPVSEDRDLPRLLLSTDSFRTAAEFPPGFPARWRLAQIHYSPIHAACGLMVFEDRRTAKGFYLPLLLRIGNPGIKADRSLAHITNGLLLLERGDRPAALAETTIAAEMAPSDGAARYQHGAMLALNGQTDAALDELEASIKLDAGNKKRALNDINYEDLAWMPRFKELCSGSTP